MYIYRLIYILHIFTNINKYMYVILREVVGVYNWFSKMLVLITDFISPSIVTSSIGDRLISN